MTLTKERIIEELKDSTQNASGMFEISEDTICNLMSLLTAPPAPVVPDAIEMDDDFDSAFEHGKAVGWNACRAAILQGGAGNSPAIPDGYALVPIEPTEGMVIQGFEAELREEFRDPEAWEAFEQMSGCEQAAQRAKWCWAAMLAAAPQQEVNNG